MKRKKLKEKSVKPVGKLHWAVVAIGFLAAIAFLELAFLAPADSAAKPWYVAISLFAFGVGFNQMVTWLEFQDWEEGATALLVVIGVGYTIFAISVLIGHFYTLFWFFAASGAPMVAGSWIRYVQQRARERKNAHDCAMENLHSNGQ